MLEILNFGGGVQSSTLAEMSFAGELPPLNASIFADTGWEPDAVYEHVEYMETRHKLHGVPFHRVSAGDLRSDALRSQVAGRAVDGTRWASMPLFTLRVWWPTAPDMAELQEAIDEYEFGDRPANEVAKLPWLWVDEDDETDAARNREATKLRAILDKLKRTDTAVEQRGMIKRQCTKEYKIEPIETFIKQTLFGLPPRKNPPAGSVRNWMGISADESQRCRGSKVAWKTHWYPHCDRFITRGGCLLWLDARGLPQPPRSACKGCPFHSDAEWRLMKMTRPEFEDTCQFDDAIRHCGGMRGNCFLHRSCQPLRDVDFSNDVDAGQILMIDDPQFLGCESGHCFM